MKFNFKLEKVLRHRKQQEDLAQRDFMESQAKLHHEEKVLESLIEQAHLAREKAFQEQTASQVNPESLKQIQEFIKGQDHRIERQKIRIKEQETLVEKYREILRQKAVEYKMIESLKNKQYEEFRKQANKDEQKKIDDIVVMRASRGRVE